jgi:hypothetical protein
VAVELQPRHPVIALFHGGASGTFKSGGSAGTRGTSSMHGCTDASPAVLGGVEQPVGHGDRGLAERHGPLGGKYVAYSDTASASPSPELSSAPNTARSSTTRSQLPTHLPARPDLTSEATARSRRHPYFSPHTHAKPPAGTWAASRNQGTLKTGPHSDRSCQVMPNRANGVRSQRLPILQIRAYSPGSGNLAHLKIVVSAVRFCP